MSSSFSNETLFLNDVEQVFRADTLDRGDNPADFTPSPFSCQGFGSSVKYNSSNVKWVFYDERTRHSRVQDFCRNLFAEVNEPTSHFSRLDELFSSLLVCNFIPSEPVSEIIDSACQRLMRLPATPLKIDNGTTQLNSSYYSPSLPSQNSESENTWDDLQVTRNFSTNTIRVALFIANYGVGAPSAMAGGFVDTVAEILEVASQLAAVAEPGLDEQKWFVVRAFLWTTWQRSSMLHLCHVLDKYLEHGVDNSKTIGIFLRGTSPSFQTSVQSMSRLSAGLMKSKHMCTWAFELLRTDPASIGLDFRRFHRRYAEIFGGRHGRCLLGSIDPCEGKSPMHCQRFTGMVTEDQSSHDWRCSKSCVKMSWDETSYRNVKGARAVSIYETDSHGGKLKYCEANEKTLAISHVWSHGQGGRPETGFNRCLHLRYVSIARSLDCDSYWMDTPCIPEDHQLRAESIAKINDVFSMSKVTLVCDRDLMEIDVDDLTLELRESILTVVLVCDWNVRAWTFLEAFRGRHAIHLLCKENAIVSLKETIEIVHRQGSIDLALLFLAVPHLLPTTPAISSRYTTQVSSRYKDIVPSIAQGFFSVETGGSLLGHRAASRPLDDIVIWSLLLNQKAFNTAEGFWRSREGTVLHTSFLLSSAPRLSIRGLGWAPSCPNPQTSSPSRSSLQSHYLAFDGSDSEPGEVRREGFSSFWAIYEFCGTRNFFHLTSLKSKRAISGKFNLQKISTRYLQKYRWAALLRPIQRNAWATPVEYRGDIKGALVIVCGSNDKEAWEWRGVYEWDLAEPLPTFTRTLSRILIV